MPGRNGSSPASASGGEISGRLRGPVGYFTRLEEKLHSLDGCDGCLGDGGGDATGQEVLGEGHRGLVHYVMLVWARLTDADITQHRGFSP